MKLPVFSTLDLARRSAPCWWPPRRRRAWAGVVRRLEASLVIRPWPPRFPDLPPRRLRPPIGTGTGAAAPPRPVQPLDTPPAMGSTSYVVSSDGGAAFGGCPSVGGDCGASGGGCS